MRSAIGRISVSPIWRRKNNLDWVLRASHCDCGLCGVLVLGLKCAIPALFYNAVPKSSPLPQTSLTSAGREE